VKSRQLLVPSRRQLGRLNQDGLQVWVALLGNGAALLLPGGADLRTAEPAITHRLGDGREPLDFTDFQGPAQCQDLADAIDTL
jgi:hypothetical protein